MDQNQDESETAEPDPTPSDTAEAATITPESVLVRRSPRYFRFMFAGAVVFAVIALILTVTFPAQQSFSRMQVFGFLLLIGVVVGIAFGSIVALMVERSGRRKGQKVVADRLEVRASRGDSAEAGEASAHNPTN
ncbi:MAG: hypothetical protein ABI255_03410 [Microbacteriaceae bacterium]